MKKIVLAVLLSMGMVIPHGVSAYEGNMSGSGATEVTYTSSDLVITSPIETVTIPKTGDSHEITGYLLALSGAFLLFLIVLYRNEEEKEKNCSQ